MQNLTVESRLHLYQPALATPMFLFKTSGRTLGSVVANQKHAFNGQPREWRVGEQVLVSKNRSDCALGERQIQFVMRLEKIRALKPGEAERYWPGSEGRWRYLVSCSDTKRLTLPFDLHQALGADATQYANVMTFKRLSPEHEARVVAFMLQREPAASS